ncbi:MAG: ABC transporter ATP-binding protein [Pseudomonadales bacterium]|jgi:ABC-type multidrug transport system fused ATPase/permease subunit|nr:ABC transporter ATP-binding protein [Pseudomonadales bacterium]|tara:strand:+ start:89 stop:2053 length:1965 start_codon:yes stop_codon:yes gene_type:complete
MNDPNQARITTAETWSLVARSLRFVWPYRYQVGVKLLLSLIGVSVILFLPWPLKILIDYVVTGVPVGASPTPFPPYVQPLVNLLYGLTPMEIVWAVVGISLIGILLIGAFGTGVATDRARGDLSQGLDTATRSENEANESGSGVSGLLGLFEYRYQLRTTHRINHRLRSLLFHRLMSLPITRFSEDSIGDAVYRVMYDTPAISRVCYDILVVPIASFYSIGVVIWTTQYSFQAVPSLIWIAWSAMPLVLISTLLMTGITRRRSLASREAGADTTATVEEGMSNIVAVQSLGANAKQRDQFDRDSEHSFSRFRSYLWMTIVLAGLQYGVGAGLSMYIFFDVAEAIIGGRMSAGDFMVLYTFFLQLMGSASALGALWFNLQDKVAGMRRVFQVIDLPVDTDHHGTRTLDSRVAGATLDAVSYDYPDGTRALQGVSMKGQVGEMIALVGSTGAGKTTLSYLLPGFIQPANGRVAINDVDVRDLQLEHLRDLVTFVFQEPVVFDDSVENNIRLGSPSATRDEIVAAARTAGALDYIEQLPDGFATQVGRAGGTLSVGQKQRLAIARGLVSRSPILILDEPTAALDPETENALVGALQQERSSRLLIIIAHRLSTIRSADRIYFIEDGRIIESGSHRELMARPSGAYRRFVELQLGEAA